MYIGDTTESEARSVLHRAVAAGGVCVCVCVCVADCLSASMCMRETLQNRNLEALNIM